MFILGVSDSHNSASCLFTADEKLFGLQEERPTRVKNFFGVPRRSNEALLTEQGLQPADITEVALANLTPFTPRNREQTIAIFRKAGRWQGRAKSWLRETPIFRYSLARRRRDRLEQYGALGFKPEQLRTYEHHSCHAATAYYGAARYDRPILVLTVDGAGDDLCASVNIGRNGVIERLHSIDWSHSIGFIYGLVTYMTGMVPDEHEYKIMGMAPYASPAAAARISAKLCDLFAWNSSGLPLWKRRAGTPHAMTLQPVLEKIFFEERFDGIMAGTQMFIETMLCEFVRRAVRSTGIADVAASGGVFMNVKANKAILELDEVDSLFVFPSCGDETNAIGAVYLALAERRGGETVPGIGSIYLGPSWDEAAIAKVLAPLQEEGFAKVEKPADLTAAVADCLAAGEVVARFAGREEFGARSLGNRAILADPRDPHVIQVINKMIKSRDFWMPFAASVLYEAAPDYLVNPKGAAAPYMILSLDTTPAGARDLAAGIHPYDKTCRPQVVTKSANPDYWALIDAFRQRTGVGGLVNTSLNLHGLPLVHGPEDAVEVLRRSGLVRLAIGPFLVTKLAA